MGVKRGERDGAGRPGARAVTEESEHTAGRDGTRRMVPSRPRAHCSICHQLLLRVSVYPRPALLRRSCLALSLSLHAQRADRHTVPVPFSFTSRRRMN
uniref:Uncharacterized protein n=1 Tax=Triticum urartu TaxID=4572 RepID=A0A8R7PGZ3_TRIUA